MNTFLQIVWLTLYPVAFLFLNTETRKKSNETENNAEVDGSSSAAGKCFTLYNAKEKLSSDKDCKESSMYTGTHFILWMIMGLLSVFWAIKELLKLRLLRGSHFGFESILRLTFIFLLWAQCVLLWCGLTEVVFAGSVVSEMFVMIGSIDIPFISITGFNEELFRNIRLESS